MSETREQVIQRIIEASADVALAIARKLNAEAWTDYHQDDEQTIVDLIVSVMKATATPRQCPTCQRLREALRKVVDNAIRDSKGHADWYIEEAEDALAWESAPETTPAPLRDTTSK